jgi:beta-glucosidase
MLTNKFPNDFLWGVALSGHQTEGDNVNSDWYAWEKLKKFKNELFSGAACDFYHCYQEDVNLAKQLNLNAFRLGIEWSRIEPKQGEFDEKEIEHYKNVLLYLKKNNFKVFLTLWHFTLPQWLAELGGWQNRKSIYYFQRYVEKIAGSFSDLVDFWLTLNEPTMYTGAAYLTGVWPPQKTSFSKTIKTFLNLVEAHKKTYRRIHQLIKNAKVGIAQNIVYFHAPLNPLDRQLSWIFNFFYNRLFHLLTKKSHDFIGLNFYYAYLVSNLNVAKKIKRIMVRSFLKKDLKVEIYPRGIFQAIKMFQKYKLPIYITENGIDDATDNERKEFIEEHLKWLNYGIKNKIDVRGYLYWSLIDNFEWQEGFEPRYGLFEVDYRTQQRKIRPSAKFYSQIAKNNGF